MEKQGIPGGVVDAIRDSVDCNLYFFGDKVALNTMYLIVAGTVIVLIAVYILLNMLHGKKQKK